MLFLEKYFLAKGLNAGNAANIPYRASANDMSAGDRHITHRNKILARYKMGESS
jgi:hypothetical protein